MLDEELARQHHALAMAHIAMALTVMAFTNMVYTVMAYAAMVYTVMAYVAMACAGRGARKAMSTQGRSAPRPHASAHASRVVICIAPRIHRTICIAPIYVGSDASQHMHCSLCTAPCAPYHIHRTICIAPYARHHMRHTTYIAPYAPDHIHRSIYTVPCAL